jgi:hypothetical protein
MRVHYGSKPTGADDTDYDVYLGATTETDFSDLRWSDANGRLLNHYTSVHGRYELVPLSARTGKQNVIMSDGTIVSSQVAGVNGGVGIAKSADDGATWSVVYEDACTIVFCDSNDNLYACTGDGLAGSSYLMLRSDDAGATWDTVLDMSAASGVILHAPLGMCEASTGTLFAGRYQDANGLVMYRSVNDGVTWAICLDTDTGPAWAAATTYARNKIVVPTTPNGHWYYSYYTTTGITGASEPTWPTTANAQVADGGVTWQEKPLQHFHSVYADPVTGYIYACVDAVNIRPVWRSVDDGVTWDVIHLSSFGDFASISSGTGYRLFGAGYSGGVGGASIRRTTDDATFTEVLGATNGSVQWIRADGTGRQFAGVTISPPNGYAQVVVSDDDGLTWNTIWIEPYNDGWLTGASLLGYQAASNLGTPTGADAAQFLIGSSSVNYDHARLYTAGTHYQALSHVRLNQLAAAGSVIRGYANAALPKPSTIDTFPDVIHDGLLARWQFNEGTGTAVADSSGNGWHGVLNHTAGKGAWSATERRFAGPTFPRITKTGGSYEFAVGDRVSIAGSDSGALALNKSFSLVAWCKLPLTTSGAHFYIAGRGTGNNCWYMSHRAAYLYLSYGNGSTVTTLPLASPMFLDSTWHQVGIVVDNSATAKMSFILDGQLLAANGTLNGQTTLSHNPAATGEWSIGADTAAGMALNGGVDEVQLYAGTLTAEQVRQLYESRWLDAETEPTVALVP